MSNLADVVDQQHTSDDNTLKKKPNDNDTLEIKRNMHTSNAESTGTCLDNSTSSGGNYSLRTVSSDCKSAIQVTTANINTHFPKKGEIWMHVGTKRFYLVLHVGKMNRKEVPLDTQLQAIYCLEEYVKAGNLNDVWIRSLVDFCDHNERLIPRFVKISHSLFEVIVMFKTTDESISYAKTDEAETHFPKKGETWMHVEEKRRYVVLHVGKLQSKEPRLDMQWQAVYCLEAHVKAGNLNEVYICSVIDNFDCNEKSISRFVKVSDPMFEMKVVCQKGG